MYTAQAAEGLLPRIQILMAYERQPSWMSRQLARAASPSFSALSNPRSEYVCEQGIYNHHDRDNASSFEAELHDRQEERKDCHLVSEGT